jgi:DNA-directed RNA polymerase specialized sigma24 family protein
MAVTHTDRDSYTRFVGETSPRLTQALIARFGGDVGREMAAEALAYGWEHWDRIAGMENPAGYLYRVGCRRGHRVRRPLLLPDPAPPQGEPLVEPGLPAALARLTDRQRVSVMMVHGAGWTVSETAELLGISAGSVYRHVDRALSRLRRFLEVNVDA